MVTVGIFLVPLFLHGLQKGRRIHPQTCVAGLGNKAHTQFGMKIYAAIGLLPNSRQELAVVPNIVVRIVVEGREH
jgi:hypothetical protein